MLTCPCCGLSCFRTLKQLLRHIRITHSFQENFSQCKFEGCARTFRCLRTFERHIYDFHNVESISNSTVEGEANEPLPVEDALEDDILDWSDDNRSEIGPTTGLVYCYYYKLLHENDYSLMIMRRRV